MNNSLRTRLMVILLLCSPMLVVAQNSLNCDQQRGKIAQLETLDINGMSPSVQRVYKQSLLKLYIRFEQCLQQDISAITAMQAAVVGTDAAQVVLEKKQSLTKEKADVDRKIAVMQTSLDLPADVVKQEPEPSSSRDDGNGQPTQAATDSPASPIPVTRNPTILEEFTCAPGNTYADPPALLTDIVARDADDAVTRNNPNRAIASAQKMILYTVIDAASPTSSRLLHGLEAYQYLGETARTDKQLGASANSDGAVSAIEKPGFARLLGFAVEHGAINKQNDGTNLTLSTSLYSLYTLNKPDTAETYDRAGILNRLGVSASFGVDNTNNDLANARRNNLKEWSVKARLFGDRSTRSARFKKFWDLEIRPVINRRLQALGGAIEGLSKENMIPGFSDFRENVELCLLDQVKKRMSDADYQSGSPDQRKKILSDLMLAYLSANVFARVKDGRLELKPEAITLIETQYVPSLKIALDDLTAAKGELAKKLDDLKKAPLGTFAYTNHRIPTGSDYSETKFLFEQDKGSFGPLKLTGNVGLSFYNKPDPTLNQQRLRDITAALSFEGTSDSPFTEGENQSKVTYSFVGRYERLFENRNVANRTPDIRVLQFVTEIPFVKGFSLPLSVTYANATEEEKKQGFRFNFGMRLDTDKLFELLGKSKP